MNAFKKALTGLAFGALLVTGAVATTPAAHAQWLSANSMSSVGGHSAVAGGFSASEAGARGSGSASFRTFGGWGGYATYSRTHSASYGFSNAMGQHAGSGFSAFGSGSVSTGSYYGY